MCPIDFPCLSPNKKKRKENIFVGLSWSRKSLEESSFWSLLAFLRDLYDVCIYSETHLLIFRYVVIQTYKKKTSLLSAVLYVLSLLHWRPFQGIYFSLCAFIIHVMDNMFLYRLNSEQTYLVIPDGFGFCLLYLSWVKPFVCCLRNRWSFNLLGSQQNWDFDALPLCVWIVQLLYQFPNNFTTLKPYSMRLGSNHDRFEFRLFPPF